MGHGSVHLNVIIDLVQALRDVIERRGWTDAFVGGDQFVAWVEHEPNVRVSPDVYLVRPAPYPAPDSWQLWRPEHLPPRFAVEIVSPSYWRKDYEDNPVKYAQIGVDELFIFDRDLLMNPRSDPERHVLQLYQREADGAFVKTYAGPGPVYSPQLGLWLLARVEGSEPRLRVSHDPEGQQLVPIGAETRQQLREERRARQLTAQREQKATQREQQATRREQEATRREQEAAQREQEATQREKQERRARLTAERELQQLRERLAHPGDPSPKPSGND